MASPDLAAVFEASPNPYLVADRELRCVAVNAAYSTLSGVAREALIGVALTDLFGRGDEASRRLGAFERVLATGRPEALPGFASYTPILDAEGKVELVLEHLGAIAPAEDITPSAVRVTLRRDVFRAWMHELRMPLSVISGYIQLLRLGTLAPDARVRALAEIERSAQQQQDLLADFGDIVAGRFALQLEPTELAGVVDVALEPVQPATEARGIELDVSLPPAIAIRADRERLQRVVRHLIQYAIHLMKTGGRVVLRAEERGGAVELSVTETFALTPDLLAHVLERFRPSTAPRSLEDAAGTIELCLHVVERHGGAVTAAANLEGGVTFTLRLPTFRPE